jgi:hypothetical protein
MAFVQQPRVSALPHGPQLVLPPSPLRRLEVLAAQRPDDPALLVPAEGGYESRSWSEVEHTVLCAGAGLLRSGLRPDQIVLSLLPTVHAHPELAISLRAIGAVVIHVSPEAGPDDLARQLADVDVRLVVSETERDLERLAGLAFRSAEMFALDGWSRLLSLGAQRLLMDPDAVKRVDRMVDPEGARGRLLRPGTTLAQVAAGSGTDAELPDAGVTLLVGDHADPFVHMVGDAHLATGGTLVHIAGPADLPDVLSHVQPTALALSAAAVAGLSDLLAVAPASGRRRRTTRTRVARAASPEALLAWFGGHHLALVVTPGLTDALTRVVAGLGAEVAVLEVGELLPADLPVPPPVIIGDASNLPRRSRRAPGRDFQFETDRAHQFDEPEESAFELPILPLFGGESFLDKLLLARADQARA